MGRITEVLRRANLDADPSPAPASPAASPWVFDGSEDAEPAAQPAATDEPLAQISVHADEGTLQASAKSRRLRIARDRFDDDAAHRLVVSKGAEPVLVEQFRSLAATLHQAQREQALKSVLVTSPAPGDGKSNVAVNLALTLSGSYGRRVLLIDADLRRPTLHRLFGLVNVRGLADALHGKDDEKLATVVLDEHLLLLPAGRPEPNPLAGLSSERMKRIVEDASKQFDWVVVDSPPVTVLADGRLVSEAVDGAILVIRAGVTRFPDVEAAIDIIGHERILGVVLNAVDPAEIRSRDYYHRYYGSGVQES